MSPTSTTATPANKGRRPSAGATPRASNTATSGSIKQSPKLTRAQASKINSTPSKTPSKPDPKLDTPKSAKNVVSTPRPKKDAATPTASKVTKTKNATLSKVNGKQSLNSNNNNVETLDSIVADMEKENVSKKSLKSSDKNSQNLLEEEASSTSASQSSEVSLEEEDSDVSENNEEDGNSSSVSDNANEELNVTSKNAPTSILKDSPVPKKETKPAEKRVSFAKEDGSTGQIKVTETPPADLNKDLGLIIKGIHFKCTPTDIKKRLPKTYFVRMPVNPKSQNQNNGFCYVFFKTQSDVDEAYQSLRENPKILSRQCFVTYLRAHNDSISKNQKNREYDTTMLHIKKFPRVRSTEIQDAMKIFPDAKCIFIKSIGHTPFVTIKFADSVAASAYLKKNITYCGQKLDIVHSYKADRVEQKRTSDSLKNSTIQNSQPNAKRQKDSEPLNAKKVTNEKKKLLSKPVEPESKENEDENASDVTDSSDEVSEENSNAEANSTDSDDESLEDGSESE